jgi:hypothetical protein
MLELNMVDSYIEKIMMIELSWRDWFKQILYFVEKSTIMYIPLSRLFQLPSSHGMVFPPVRISVSPITIPYRIHSFPFLKGFFISLRLPSLSFSSPGPSYLKLPTSSCSFYSQTAPYLLHHHLRASNLLIFFTSC